MKSQIRMLGILLLILTICSSAIGGQAVGDDDYCFPATRLAISQLDQFARSAENIKDSRLRAAVTAEQFEPLNDAAVCSRLNEKLVEVHAETAIRDDGVEAHPWEVSYFRLGDVYAVVILSRPLETLEEMRQPLRRITTNSANYVQLRDKNLNILGVFDTLGRSVD